MSVIGDLSKNAFARVITTFITEACFLLEHPFSILNFFSGSIPIGNATVDENILSLGIINANECLWVASSEPMLRICDMYGFGGKALVKCREDDTKRYLLIFNIHTQEEWWIEGDLHENTFKIISYEQIPDHIREEIQIALIQTAWHQLKVEVKMPNSLEEGNLSS